MNAPSAEAVVFWVLAGLTLAGGWVVARSRNIVHSALALLATFLGVAGLYALLNADLMAVVELLVYVGGVLVLILFAVMLTARIDRAETSNLSFGWARGVGVLLAVCAPLIWLIFNYPWRVELADGAPTTAAMGAALLDGYVLPFEVVSVLLVAALVGAVTLARSRDFTRRPASTSSERFQPIHRMATEEESP
jgi:NADH-quinone oxidoreductase subunit J